MGRRRGQGNGQGGGGQQDGGARRSGGGRPSSSPSQGQLTAAQRKLDNLVSKFTSKFEAITKKVEQ
eukprot:8200379-Lingulodinium_polyedra.AAC.1